MNPEIVGGCSQSSIVKESRCRAWAPRGLLKNCFRPRYFTPAAKAAIENTAGYGSAEALRHPKSATMASSSAAC
jgi:hypothetical protein